MPTLLSAFADASDWTSELAGGVCGAQRVADTLNYKVKCCCFFLFPENDILKSCNIYTLCFLIPRKPDGAGLFLKHLQLLSVQWMPTTTAGNTEFGKADR